MSDDPDGLAAVADEPPDQVRTRYDSWVGSYNADLHSWNYQVPALMVDRLRALDVGSGPILDAGCGTGLIGRALAESGFGPIDGCDFSTSSIAAAAITGVYRSLFEADLSSTLASEGSSYAAVVCGGVFSYIHDVQKALAELLRVCVEGGAVLATQRTDLWEPRGTASAIDVLVKEGLCDAQVSDPLPYLPEHPEFADDVLIHLIVLRPTKP